MDIEFNPNGFIRTIQYTADLHYISNAFADRFPGLETMVVNLVERYPNGNDSPYSFKFSDDDKKCVVGVFFDRYYRGNKLTAPPSPAEVYATTQRILERIIHEYASILEEKAKPVRKDEEVLTGIKKKWKEISEFDYLNKSPYSLQHLAQEMFDLIGELSKSENKDTKFRTTGVLAALGHSMNKELKYAESHYEKTKKNNAPRVRTTEYHESMRHAINRIHTDIITLLID